MSEDVQVSPALPKTWMNIASLVAAVLGIAPAAIVLGHLGVAASRRGEADLKPLGIAGLVIGYCAFVLAVLVVIVVIALLVAAGESCTIDPVTNTCVIGA